MGGDRQGIFDTAAVPWGLFDVCGQDQGWFDRDLLYIPQLVPIPPTPPVPPPSPSPNSGGGGGAYYPRYADPICFDDWLIKKIEVAEEVEIDEKYEEKEQEKVAIVLVRDESPPPKEVLVEEPYEPEVIIVEIQAKDEIESTRKERHKETIVVVEKEVERIVEVERLVETPPKIIQQLTRPQIAPTVYVPPQASLLPQWRTYLMGAVVGAALSIAIIAASSGNRKPPKKKRKKRLKR